MCCLPQDSLLAQLSEPLLTAAEAHNQLQVERLLRLCRQGAAMQQQAEQVAAQLKDTYYELTAQLRDIQAQEVGEGHGRCWQQHSGVTGSHKLH